MKNIKMRLEIYFVIITAMLILLASIPVLRLGINPIYLYGAAFLIGGFFKAKEGIKNTIKERSLNVEILMILAAIGAFILGHYYEGSILIFIFSLSGVLESYALQTSKKALTHLLNLTPQMTTLYQDGNETEVLANSLSIDDCVIVKVGQQVPVDGLIVEGQSSLDQSSITGEFIPVLRAVDDPVYAGSINLESTIIVKVNKYAHETILQKMINLVNQAQAQKTKSQNYIDRFETYYVYSVILLSMLMMLTPFLGWLTWQSAFYRGIIILVVGSPCALVASITPGILATLSAAAKKRILVKSGATLETINQIKVIFFDKTGTLTTGKPEVIEIIDLDTSIKESRAVFYALEKQSNHPLAKAICKHLNLNKKLKIETKEVSGRGVSAVYENQTWQVGRFDFNFLNQDDQTRYQSYLEEGYTAIPLILDGIIISYAILQDTLRPNIKKMISQLKALNITPILLTGDHEQSAKWIASLCGIDIYHADCFPHDKVKYVMQYQRQFGKGMMIGDGINDAPALASATLGVSLAFATDISLEASDIIFMNDQIANLPYLFGLTRRMKNIHLQNIVFSIAVIIILMMSNVFGLIYLPVGVIAHETSTILVIMNAMRLLIKTRAK